MNRKYLIMYLNNKLRTVNSGRTKFCHRFIVAVYLAFNLTLKIHHIYQVLDTQWLISVSPYIFQSRNIEFQIWLLVCFVIRLKQLWHLSLHHLIPLSTSVSTPYNIPYKLHEFVTIIKKTIKNLLSHPLCINIIFLIVKDNSHSENTCL